jgi:hypothetical protein
MNRNCWIAVAGIGLLFGVAPAWAHHAFAAEFDSSKPLHLRGTVTKVEWINPHAWIHLDVKNADNTVTSWMIEGGAPNSLLRRGITKASLPPGTELVVDGFQAKDGTSRANGQTITQSDGTKLFISGQGTGAPGDKSKENEKTNEK